MHTACMSPTIDECVVHLPHCECKLFNLQGLVEWRLMLPTKLSKAATFCMSGQALKCFRFLSGVATMYHNGM